MAQLAWSTPGARAPPNEDSPLVEFDEGNLLALDRFPGHDRHEHGLRGAVGLNWTLYDGGSPLGATVGPGVAAADADPSFSDSSGLAGTASDWLVALRIGLGDASVDDLAQR